MYYEHFSAETPWHWLETCTVADYPETVEVSESSDGYMSIFDVISGVRRRDGCDKAV
jgi:hypothetical protein